mgnify:CR=1 FL=1
MLESIAIHVGLLLVPILLSITLTPGGPVNERGIAAAVNMWMARALPFAIGIGLLVLAVDIRRLVRAKNA